MNAIEYVPPRCGAKAPDDDRFVCRLWAGHGGEHSASLMLWRTWSVVDAAGGGE